jgi:uncharacterized membrane protein
MTQETEPSYETREQETRQLERLIFFSDAVFAIAITLLVLDLRVPDSSASIELAGMGPKLFGFALSFAVIGAYWLYHHVLFGPLLREDLLLRVTNLAFLASIVFLPFPTSVITEFHATQQSVIFYALSVALVGFLATILTWVARRRGFARAESNCISTQARMVRSIVTPAVFASSAGIAVYNPNLAMQVWWLSAVLPWLVARLTRRFIRSSGP